MKKRILDLYWDGENITYAGIYYVVALDAIISCHTAVFFGFYSVEVADNSEIEEFVSISIIRRLLGRGDIVYLGVL